MVSIYHTRGSFVVQRNADVRKRIPGACRAPLLSALLHAGEQVDGDESALDHCGVHAIVGGVKVRTALPHLGSLPLEIATREIRPIPMVVVTIKLVFAVPQCHQ